MSGTNIDYAIAVAMPCPVPTKAMLLPGTHPRLGAKSSLYQLTPPLLWVAAYLMSYALATRCPVLRPGMLLPGGSAEPVARYRSASGISEMEGRIAALSRVLCACYAVSGTEIRNNATRCYVATTLLGVLPAYALATRCPDPGTAVSAKVLHPHYEMSGTNNGYAATRRSYCSDAVLQRSAGGSLVQTPLSAYARAMRCPVLMSRMVLSAYACAMQCPVLRQRMMLLPGYSTMGLQPQVSGRCLVLPATCLRACYAMPGTHIQRIQQYRHAIWCYQESFKTVLTYYMMLPSELLGSTELLYGATRRVGITVSDPPPSRSTCKLHEGAIGLRACYAMSGTALASASLCLRTRYAMPGTDLLLSAYAAGTTCVLLNRRLFQPATPFLLSLHTDTHTPVPRVAVVLNPSYDPRPPIQNVCTRVYPTEPRTVPTVAGQLYYRLRARYAMSGTDVLTRHCTCYAMSGTELAFGATRTLRMSRVGSDTPTPGTPALSPYALGVYCAMSSTNVGFDATRAITTPVLKLKPGSYVLVPMLFAQGREGDFKIELWSTARPVAPPLWCYAFAMRCP
eukprot:3142703-Rhodomonas_salina.1